jgi:hypothetical protein
MKARTFFTLIILFFTFFSCKDSKENIFIDKTYQDTIKQNIGGLLIRDIHYSEDIHSYDSYIKYLYKLDNTYIIGSGNYHGQEIPKDEQLIQFYNWIILKTGNSFNGDKIIIGDVKTKLWIEYEISPQTIEQDSIWQKQNVNSEPNNGDSNVTIENIKANGEFSVIYKFAKKNRIFSFMTSKRRINYTINIQTGQPEMKIVSEL